MTLFELMVLLKLDRSEFNRDLEQTRDDSESTLKKIGGGATAAAKTLAPLSKVTMDIGKQILNTGMEFDAGLAKVQAISGATGDEMARVREEALKMAEGSVFTTGQVTEALTYMGMAGWRADEMIAGLPGILSLAAASGEDLGTTSDIVTDALTALGESEDRAGRLADVMATASSRSNTNVAMMGETFKYVAPMAGTLGYSMEDLALAIGLMANSGIKSSQAGTSLRMILTRMAKQPKEAAQAMKMLGVSLDDGQGNMLSFRDVMLQLRDAMHNKLQISSEELTEALADLDAQLENGEITETEYNKALETLNKRAFGASEAIMVATAAQLGGTNALSGLMAIINASDEDFNELANAIDGSSEAMARLEDGSIVPLSQALEEGSTVIEEYNGMADAMAGTMLNSTQGSMQLLQSKLDVLFTQLSTMIIPVMDKVIGVLTKAVDWVSGLDDGTKQMLVTAGTVIAFAAPILGIVGTIANGLSGLSSVISMVSGVLPGLGSGFSNLTGILSGVSASTLAMVGGFALAITEILGGIQQLTEAHAVYEEAFNAHQNEMNTALTEYARLYNEKGKEVADQWAAMVYQIDTTGMNLEQAQAALANEVEHNWDGVPQGMWEGFKQGFDHYFGSNGVGLIQFGKDVWGGFVNGVKGLLGINSPSTVFNDIGSNTIAGFLNGVQNAWGNITSFFSNAFNNLINSATTWGSHLASGIANGINSAIGFVQNAASSIASAISNLLHFSRPEEGPLREYETWMPDFISGLANGINENAYKIHDAMTGVAESMADPFADFDGNVTAISQYGPGVTSQGFIGTDAASSSDGSFGRMEAILQQILVYIQHTGVYLDSGALVGQLKGQIDNALGEMSDTYRREVAY